MHETDSHWPILHGAGPPKIEFVGVENWENELRITCNYSNFKENSSKGKLHK